MKTRDRILEHTLALFNAQGTAAVSTNHIAEAVGISPGNLYYHFRNKEEIIRALFEQMFDRWDAMFALPEDDAPLTIALIQDFVRANFTVMYAYRYVYRELIALLRQDPVLHQRYREVRERGYIGFHEIFAALAASGLLRQALDEATVTGLADLCWLISEFWLASVEISAETTGELIDETHIQRGIDRMMLILNPYLFT